MNVKMARHILKLSSLNIFHNNSENNNKITLTCVLTTIYLEDPVNKQAASNLYTCCVPEVLLEAGYLKFSKSLTNHVLLSRLVTNPGLLNKHLLNINLTHRIVELENCEFWAPNEENYAVQKTG